MNLEKAKRPGVTFAGYLYLLLPAFFFFTDAPGQSGENYFIKQFTSRKGLPQNSIRAMVMDQDKFLWLATEGGLVRFDGRHFRLFSHHSNPEINSNRFIRIYKTHDGEILAMEVTGTIFKIKNGQIELIRKGDPGNIPTHVIHSGPPDTQFLLDCLNGNFPHLDKSEISKSLTVVFPFTPNKYAIRTNTGLTLIENGRKTVRIPIPQPESGEYFRIGNNIFFLNSKKEFYYMDLRNGTHRNAELSGDLDSTIFKNILLNKNIVWNNNYPDVFLKLKNRLYRLESGQDPHRIHASLVSSQLPSACVVTDAFYDRESRNLFIGTDTKGMYIFHNNQLTTLLFNDSLDSRSNSYYSQCEIDSHTVLVSFQRAFRLSGAFRSVIPNNHASSETQITDKKGRFWFVSHTGINRFDPSTGVMKIIPSIPENGITCYYEEGDSVFVAGDHGVGYVKNDVYKHLTSDEEVSGINMKIETMTRGPDGRLWIAMCSGVAILNAGTWETEFIETLKGVCARSLFVHGDRIFIGSYGQGYFCIEKGKTTHFPTDQGNSLAFVHSFLIDHKNYLWMSTNQGLFRTRYENIDHYLRDSTVEINYQYFGEEDGIANTEFNGGCSPPVVRLKNGYVSYPTMEGLVWLVPEEIDECLPDQQIIIDDVIVDGIALNPFTEITLPADHENIRISYSTPYWSNPVNLRTEYKLTGFNRSWMELNPNDRWIEFTNLPSGTYTLEIRNQGITASNVAGFVTLQFEVRKKFYEENWFILLSFVSAAYLFGWLLQWKSRRVIRKNQELELKIKERTDELSKANEKLAENLSVLEDKEQTLRDTMSVKDKMISVLSHDIITPLKFISMVSRISKKNPDLIDRKKLVESMKDIEFASDKLYNNATNILNWMKYQNKRIIPATDYLAVFDFIEELSEPLRGMAEIQGIRIRNEIPEEEIVRADRNILMIILQNLLSNAIKYSGADTITFSSKLVPGRYFISVTDNGIGIPESTLEQIERIRSGTDHLTGEFRNREEGNHLGYYIIMDFLQLLHGNIQITSANGKGTQVTIDFPVENK
jgi:signal transduction histidine kinase